MLIVRWWESLSQCLLASWNGICLRQADAGMLTTELIPWAQILPSIFWARWHCGAGLQNSPAHTVPCFQASGSGFKLSISANYCWTPADQGWRCHLAIRILPTANAYAWVVLTIPFIQYFRAYQVLPLRVRPSSLTVGSGNLLVCLACKFTSLYRLLSVHFHDFPFFSFPFFLPPHPCFSECVQVPCHEIFI